MSKPYVYNYQERITRKADVRVKLSKRLAQTEFNGDRDKIGVFIGHAIQRAHNRANQLDTHLTADLVINEIDNFIEQPVQVHDISVYFTYN